MSAVKIWKRSVRTHHAQSVRAQAGYRAADDFWRPFASRFQADPRRTDDSTFNRLTQEVGPDATVLDVGGGGGRFALPLALRCRHVAVVEPSQSMVDVLRQGADDAGIHNITVVQETWEDAQAEPADLVLCSHVLYGVEDVNPFIRKMDSHATDRVLVLMLADSPQSHLSSLWKRVHEEDRINLPALREVLPVLWEMDIHPDLEMLDRSDPELYDSWEDALEEFRRRLYVDPDTENDLRLKEAMKHLLEDTSEGLTLRGVPPRCPGLLSWRAG